MNGIEWHATVIALALPAAVSAGLSLSRRKKQNPFRKGGTMSIPKRLAAFSAALLMIPAAALSQPPSDNWHIVWNDEFEGTEVDQTKWNIRDNYTYWGVSLRADYVSVRDGKLILKMDGRSGWVDTEDKFIFEHGYIEARVRLSSSNQMNKVWPCWWMKRGFPAGEWKPEYDIAELYVPDDQSKYTVIHANHFDSGDEHHDTGKRRDEWHTYGVLVQPGERIKYYIDGEMSWHCNLSDPGVPVICILHAMTAGGSAPYPDFEVDFIRYYEEGAPEPAAPTIATQPEDQRVGVGKNATFTVSADGWPLNYQWRRDGQDIDGATGASYTLDNVAWGDDGAVFSVTVSNELGDVTSEEAVLTVLEWDGIMAAEDFPRDNTEFIWEDDNGVLRVAFDDADGEAQVSQLFPGKDGTYDVIINVHAETDGQSQFKVLVNGQEVGTTYTAPLADGEQAGTIAENVPVKKGDEITVWGKQSESSWARWKSVEFQLQQASATIGGVHDASQEAVAHLNLRYGNGSLIRGFHLESAAHTARLLDAKGRVIATFRAGADPSELTTARNLNPGIYLLRVLTATGSATQRISILR